MYGEGLFLLNSSVMINILITFFTTLTVAFILTKKPLALSMPTDRGLHEKNTPTSSGIALAIGYIFGILLDFSSWFDYMAILLIIIAFVGFLDDKYRISKEFRFLIQIILACLFVYSFGDTSLISFIGFMYIFMIVYSINAYNFMDGIDSLILFQSIFVLSSLLLLAPNSIVIQYLHIDLILAALIALLFFGKSPSKLFLGNSGSYFLGLYLSMIIITVLYYWDISFLTYSILFTIILIDTIYVILKRFFVKLSNLYRENKNLHISIYISLKHITEPHCTHNYQKLTKKINSHAKVVFILMLYNILWCLPLAIASAKFDDYALLCLALSFIPYIIWCYINNAGVESN